MSATLQEKLAALPEARRQAVLDETERLFGEYLTLKDLRKARELTQAQLAADLGVRQSTVAQMEKRSDLLLSTIRNYVEAVGGSLRIVVEFPDRPTVALSGLGEAESDVTSEK